MYKYSNICRNNLPPSIHNDFKICLVDIGFTAYLIFFQRSTKDGVSNYANGIV